MKTHISVENAAFGYGGGPTVLESVSLDISRGEFIAAIGPSGCGKSTLLRLLAGLEKVDKGRIRVNGEPIDGPGLDRAVVFQDYSLFPWINCRDNIVLALEQAGMGENKKHRKGVADAYLEMVGLSGHGNKLPGELSGGMRQRAAIARAFAVNAPALLMDEPFGALDEITRIRQQNVLLELWQTGRGDAGKTVFLVTHDVEEALILSGRVLVMGSRPGRIAYDVPIDLGRPRLRKDALAHPRFYALRDDLLRKLNQVVEEQLESDAAAGGGGGI